MVTNARTPGARCYGYVTMATSEDASKCIQHLHRTELHGRMISVERVSDDFLAISFVSFATARILCTMMNCLCGSLSIRIRCQITFSPLPKDGVR